MVRQRRGYSDEEVDAYVLADQEQRAGRRNRDLAADPRWGLVPDPDWPELGLTWREKQEA